MGWFLTTQASLLSGARNSRRHPRYLASSFLVLLAVGGCGGTSQSQAPRLAVGSHPGPPELRTPPRSERHSRSKEHSTFRHRSRRLQTYLGRRYAGAWIINNGRHGVLYIGVVHLTSPDRQYARNHIRMGRKGGISLVNERYSMAQLNAYNAVVTKYAERTGKRAVLKRHPFLGFGVSSPDNAVRFTLPEKDAEFWATPILRLVPYSAFVVQYSSATAHALRVRVQGEPGTLASTSDTACPTLVNGATQCKSGWLLATR